eukprot:2265460-Amphidinium_carterae.2
MPAESTMKVDETHLRAQAIRAGRRVFTWHGKLGKYIIAGAMVISGFRNETTQCQQPANLYPVYGRILILAQNAKQSHQSLHYPQADNPKGQK